MDLIYTNADKIEQGVILNYSLDLEESVDKDRCTFEVQTTIQDSVLELGSFVYIDTTEYGGRVDTLKVDTSANVVYASGRTWRGMLGSKVIIPQEAYYTAEGTIQQVLETLISDLELNDIFEVDCKVPFSVNYKFDRYTDAYTGISKMLGKYGHKLVLEYSVPKHKVILSTFPISDFSNEAEITSDLFAFKLQMGKPAVNHLIGLGSGELENRMVVHKYLQADGTVGNIQYYVGADEIVDVYDYSSVESYEELEEQTTEELLSRSNADTLEVTAYDLAADIGDKFTAYDVKTKLSMTQYVTTKIVTINHGLIEYSYGVGEK